MSDQRAESRRKADRRMAREMWWWEWGEIVLVYGFIAVVIAMFGVIFWIGTHR